VRGWPDDPAWEECVVENSFPAPNADGRSGLRSGLFVNTVSPEEAAARLRAVELD
jgi:hypothetical protein